MKKIILPLILVASLGNSQTIFNTPSRVVSSSGGGGGTSGTINSGTAGQMAYYSGSSSISAATGLFTNGTGTVTGTTVSFTNVNGQNASFTTITGPLATAAQPNVTSVGTLTNLSVAGTVTTTTLNATGTASATTFLASDADLAGTPAYSWAADPNSGMYNAAADAVGLSAGGTDRFRVTGGGTPRAAMSTDLLIGQTISNNNFPSATIHVLGTAFVSGVISSTTGYVHLGSPTTVPTCDATNKGNVFMNTTTNCLNYCDGTANRQVTSAAAVCT